MAPTNREREHAITNVTLPNEVAVQLAEAMGGLYGAYGRLMFEVRIIEEKSTVALSTYTVYSVTNGRGLAAGTRDTHRKVASAFLSGWHACTRNMKEHSNGRVHQPGNHTSEPVDSLGVPTAGGADAAGV